MRELLEGVSSTFSPVRSVNLGAKSNTLL